MRLLPALLLAISAAAPARALDITGCPAVVPRGEIGVVQADFDCVGSSPDSPNFPIVLERGARLDLNGHTITFVQTSLTIAPVTCEAACEVHGPGTLRKGSGAGAGIWTAAGRPASIHDLDISGFHTGIAAPRGRVTLANVAIDSTHMGIVAARRLELAHVLVSLPGGPFGTVGGVGECIGATQRGGRVRGDDVTVSGCLHGVYGTRGVEVSALSVSSSYIGVFSAGGVELSDSTVTGSEYADIYSGRRPELTNTSCDTSLRYLVSAALPDGPWGVCAND